MKDAPCRFCCRVRVWVAYSVTALIMLGMAVVIPAAAIMTGNWGHGLLSLGLFGGWMLWAWFDRSPEPPDGWFECPVTPRRRGGFAGARLVPKPTMPSPSSTMAQDSFLDNLWAATLRDWQSSAPPARKDEVLPFPAPLPWPLRLPAEKEPVRLSPPRRPSWLRRLLAENQPARLPRPVSEEPIDWVFTGRKPVWVRERKTGGKE